MEPIRFARHHRPAVARGRLERVLGAELSGHREAELRRGAGKERRWLGPQACVGADRPPRQPAQDGEEEEQRARRRRPTAPSCRIGRLAPGRPAARAPPGPAATGPLRRRWRAPRRSRRRTHHRDRSPPRSASASAPWRAGRRPDSPRVRRAARAPDPRAPGGRGRPTRRAPPGRPPADGWPPAPVGGPCRACEWRRCSPGRPGRRGASRTAWKAGTPALPSRRRTPTHENTTAPGSRSATAVAAGGSTALAVWSN